MARKSREQWSPKYRRRVEASERRYGALFERDQAAARQRARGHKPREHVTRRERIVSRGATPTSSADYAFLAKQRPRVPHLNARIIGELPDGRPHLKAYTADENYDRARAAYLRLGTDERAAFRASQRLLERRYSGFKRRQARTPVSEHQALGLMDNQYTDTSFYEHFKDYEDDIEPLAYYH
jgi:hypothetical protein